MARIFDLIMTHKLDADDFFIHRIQQECARAGLNFFLIEPLFVERFHELLRADALVAALAEQLVVGAQTLLTPRT